MQAQVVKQQQFEDLKSGLQKMLKRFVSAASEGQFGAAKLYMTTVMDSLPEPPVGQEGEADA